MFSTILKKSRTNLAFCSLLLFAACGGGGGNPDPNPNPPPDPGTTLGLDSKYTDIVEQTTLGKPNWPEGSGTGSPIDGVKCLVTEDYHIHGMVSIYRDGTRLALPAAIGLVGCSYELHTHDSSGVVHVETSVKTKFTFGQFFEVWGQPLGASNVGGISGTVKFYIIDNETVTPYTGNPADIEITPHRELAIVIGTPPAALARHRWPKEL
jgi:hypothetical protein